MTVKWDAKIDYLAVTNNSISNLNEVEDTKTKLSNQLVLQNNQNLNNKLNYLNVNNHLSLLDIDSSINQTNDKLSNIRNESNNSQSIIKNMILDIKTLNQVKTNLVNTMKVLKSLQLLVNLTNQINYQLNQQLYTNLAKQIEELNGLIEFLTPLARVPRIADLLTQSQLVLSNLKQNLINDFKQYWSSSLSLDMGGERQRKKIKESAILIECLGENNKTDIINWFTQYTLKDYKRIFKPTDEAGQLDNLSRRFSWFNRVLNHFQDQQSLSNIWPKHWNVKKSLLALFVSYTNEDLKFVLSNTKLNVDNLIEAIKLTKEFETQMSTGVGVIFDDKNFQSISITYQNVFNVYFIHQDNVLSDVFSKFSDSTSLQDGQDNHTASVLESSSDLFFNYRQITGQCAALTYDKPIVDLSKLFSKWLRVYGNDVLKSKLNNVATSRKSLESRVNSNEIKVAGLIINTADYCLSTAAQLEEKLKEYVTTSLKEQITFEEERQLFNSIIAICIQKDLHNFEIGIEAPLSQMSQIQWSQIGNTKKNTNSPSSVTNPSQYVTELSNIINEICKQVHEVIDHRRYYRSYLDKSVTLTIALITRIVVKSRPLSSLGVEQLLLDLQSIRQTFIDLIDSPKDAGSSTSTTSAYARHVNRTFMPLETLLKVVLSPSIPAEAFVQSYTTLIADNSSQNFQKVMDMKGLGKKDQGQLQEIFKAVTDNETQTNLNSTSFLTELDMNPSSRPIIPLSVINTRAEDINDSPLDSRNNSKNNSPAVPMFSDFKKLFMRKN